MFSSPQTVLASLPLNKPQKVMLIGIERKKAEELASEECIHMEQQREREREEERRRLAEEGT